ncbi:MAG TPA: CaiB/BaiF CoA-transferase family protein [Actinomycetota bacterium]|nr:CaiB/BaiF CoA-transferase family protein [Actinomycetota bacterium]
MASSAPLPLEGTVVLDLTRLLPGNYATLLLADLGADVVKVEEPGRGDYIRWMPPMVDGDGAIHRALNRNKRSLTLNLKDPEGVRLLRRLAEGADALVESFRPGVLDRLGAGYEALAEANERLVYCAITGFGQDGPYRDRVGHDINYIGYAGLLDATGTPDGPPVLPSVQVGDFGGGMAAALGLAAAVADARRSGRGRFVDVSMLDVVTSWLGVLSSWYLAMGTPPPRGGMPLTGGMAWYRVYRTRDGRHLAVGAIEERFWRALCDELGVPDLADEQYAPRERQEEIAARLGAIFASMDRDEWVRRLAPLEACVGPVNDVGEAMEDPQIVHRGTVARVNGVPVGPGPAIKVSATDPKEPAAAPALGEHTGEILRSLGLDEEQISDLRAHRIV